MTGPNGGDDDLLDGITLVPEPTHDWLNEHQLVDYRNEREQCLKWQLTFGKNPDRADGYAHGTVKTRTYRMDRFYRWVWSEHGYTTDITTDHADAYLRHLAHMDKSNAHKNACRKSLMMLYKWRHHQRGGDAWDPEITFSQPNQSSIPRDYLTDDERSKVRNAALEDGTVPSFDNAYGERRDRWKAYLAQRFGMPKSELTREDWERANSWKIPTLVWTSLDGGLRPIEVERARTSWVDIDNEVLRIPREDAAKSSTDWIVSLQSKTVEMLEKWLTERATIEKYEDTDKLWLTRFGNPYQSQSLRRLLHRLCDAADIDTEDRKMSWYSIRHSTGTYMVTEEDPSAAQAQLRHRSPETTIKYSQAPPESRQDALDRMG